jgi:type 1 fimbria pilin
MTHDLPVKALLVLGALFSSPLWAVDNVQFRGTLIEPAPCKISDGELIDVDFGDRVGVNKVDGVNYQQPLNYRITCEPGSSGLDMMLTLSGQATSYDTAAVRTNITDLGIRVLQNSTPFTLNQPLKIDSKNPPKLEAVPVKTPGSTLKGGAFVATANLQVSYQ